MIEVFDPPLYFAWRWEQNLPYVVHFYVAKQARSFVASLACVKQLRAYFAELGFHRILLNARCEEPRIQRAIEHHFKVRSYGAADAHKFYLVEV